MDVGVTTRSFPELTNAQTADFLAQNGLMSTELCFSQTDSKFWVYNGRSDLSAMTDDRSQEIVETYRSRGIDVVALGVFTNLIDPDEAERAANLAYYERMMQIGALNGIRCLPTEDGNDWFARYRAECDRVQAGMQAIRPETGIDIDIRLLAPGCRKETDGEAERLARQLTGDNGEHAVSYGTEAGHFHPE